MDVLGRLNYCFEGGMVQLVAFKSKNLCPWDLSFNGYHTWNMIRNWFD
jgi:hypothetical protein